MPYHSPNTKAPNSICSQCFTLPRSKTNAFSRIFCYPRHGSKRLICCHSLLDKKRGTDWKLIYKEEFESKTEALKREKWLKTGTGREYLEKNFNQQ